MSNVNLSELFKEEGELRFLRGGDTLLVSKSRGQHIYLLVAGRVAALDQPEEGPARVVAVYRPGAIIGAAEFLSGDRHSTSLTALRDSELQVLSYTALESISNAHPELLAELARVSFARLRAQTIQTLRKASILGFVAVCDSVSMRALVESLAARMRAQGASVAVLGAGAENSPPTYLSDLEARHDYVLMAAERQDFDFTQYCGRQIDRLVLVGSAHSPLPDGPLSFAAVAIKRHRLLDFILVQPEDTKRPTNSTRWLAAAPVARLFQIRKDDIGDLDRLARVFAGRSVGVVLSGGGARAYAHIGVLHALKELGIGVDFVAGTSMGAVIAAGVAMGWSMEELDRRIRDAFVSSSPLSDIAFPLLAMTRGGEVERRLDAHFGDVEISDLWRPFMCVSTDLTTGGLHTHRSGMLRKALRASISLPGILPPVVLDGHVLVDGALVRNLPTDLMREQHDGLTIGVNVAEASGLRPDELMLKPSGLRWLTSGAWLKGPPIVSVLIRSATLPATRVTEVGVREALDVTINPHLDNVQLRDWKSYDPAVAAGYQAAMEKRGLLTNVDM